MADFANVVVVDNGTASFKAGFRSEGSPQFAIPSFVAKGRQMGGSMLTLVGQEAKARQRMMTVTNPLREGMIENWEGAEAIWEHIFDSKLQISPCDCAVLMTEPSFNHRFNRERLTEIMMEKFRVPAFYLAKQSSLSLRAVGVNTGIALMSGAGYTASVPIRNGKVVEEAVMKSIVAGDRLDGLMRQLVNREGGEELRDLETARDIKEKLGYVVNDFRLEMEKDDSEHEKTYQRMDGVDMTLKSALFQCPEALFQPCIIDDYSPNISEMVNSSVEKCPESVHAEMLGNIVISGGSTMFPNFEVRLEKELRATSFMPDAIKVVAEPERQNLVWRGGAMLADECTGQNLWINQQDYREHGSNVVHNKCP